MSWRSSTPEPVQDDLDALLDSALSAAEHLLDKNGEFYPFAMTLDDEGDTALVAGLEDEDDHPSSQAVLELLYEALTQDREARRCVAFVALVLGEEGDAVRVESEHRDGGPAPVVFLPYARKRLRRSIAFGDMVAEVGARRIWP